MVAASKVLSVSSLTNTLLETAINRCLRLDPEASDALASVQGTVVLLKVSGTGYEFLLRLGGGGVEVLPLASESPDITLIGSPFALERLMTALGDSEDPFSSGVSISGDVAMAQRLKSIVNRLHIDWEEQLSHVVGDIAAHEVGNVARTIAAWGRRTQQTLFQDVGEYLCEEIRLVPARTELDAYLSAVDVLRDDVERLDKRIERLLRTRAGPGA